MLGWFFVAAQNIHKWLGTQKNCEGSGISLVHCILSYNDHAFDAYLNYFAISLTSISLLLALLLFNPNKYSLFVRQFFWIILLIGLFLFQIILCVVVECAGVSIIWRALCGFIPFTFYSIQSFDSSVYEKQKNLHIISITMYISLVYCIVLLIYYAIVAYAITTVAHFCALLLGLLIGYSFLRNMYTDHAILSKKPLSKSGY